MLDRIRGGLIVSIQPEAHSVLNTPAFVAALACCAQANGAAAVRIEGIERIAAVREAVTIPIVGLVKRVDAGFEPYITTSIEDADAIVEAGAEVVAFDATPRARPGGVRIDDLIEAIDESGAVAMADCSTYEQGVAAAAAGAEIIATTLYGYTPETNAFHPPALELVARFSSLHPFAVCEGGIATPAQVARAFAAGASAVCAGTALTNIDALVRGFAQATPKGRNS